MVKSLEFFLKAATYMCITGEIFFVLVKSYSVLPVHLQCIMEKALFLRFFFKGLTLY